MAVSKDPQKKRIVLFEFLDGDVPVLDVVRIHSLYDSSIFFSSNENRHIFLETYLEIDVLAKMYDKWKISECQKLNKHFSL